MLCDGNQDGGGWIVILRRKDGSFDFTLPSYNDYASSTQGSFEGEFFLALDFIHLLTSSTQMELMIRLRDGLDTAWAYYDSFSVGSGSDKYRLSVSGFDPSSPAGDSLLYHNGMKWSSPDQDNDSSTAHCAANMQTSWWYRDCRLSNLLGICGDGVNALGNFWSAWGGPAL